MALTCHAEGAVNMRGWDGGQETGRQGQTRAQGGCPARREGVTWPAGRARAGGTAGVPKKVLRGEGSGDTCGDKRQACAPYQGHPRLVCPATTTQGHARDRYASTTKAAETEVKTEVEIEVKMR